MWSVLKKHSDMMMCHLMFRLITSFFPRSVISNLKTSSLLYSSFFLRIKISPCVILPATLLLLLSYTMFVSLSVLFSPSIGVEPRALWVLGKQPPPPAVFPALLYLLVLLLPHRVAFCLISSVPCQGREIIELSVFLL